MPCCKLPIPLDVCPCCGGGVKQTRGWTWIDPQPWLQGPCTVIHGVNAGLRPMCPTADPATLGNKVGLLWIGAGFYPTPDAFLHEAELLGISRRITAIPRGFKLGEHWVFLAHPKGYPRIDPEKSAAGGGAEAVTWVPAIFRIFKPTAIEKIVTQTQSQDAEEMAKLEKLGVTPVVVPDNDLDHQGSVYDRDEEDQLELIS
jgi:hypothetical protein